MVQPVGVGCMWVAVVSFVLFLYTELTVKHPMINLKIFKDHNFSLANLIVFIFGIGMFREHLPNPFVHAGFTGVFGLSDGIVLPARGIFAGSGIPVGGQCFPVGEPESGDRAGIIPVVCQLLHELLLLLSHG